jgi:hypothetical protein
MSSTLIDEQLAGFGARFKEAFRHERNSVIARKLDKTDSAIKNYVDGRVPEAPVLIEISELTGCSIHWLITGKGPKYIQAPDGTVLDEERLKALQEFADTSARAAELLAQITGKNPAKG